MLKRKISFWWNRIRIGFINYIRTPVDKKLLLSKTVNQLHLTFDYILMLTVSTLISTLGLLINSAAIVIGGMIISPLMVPIISLSYGIYVGNIKIIKQSLNILVKSIIIAVTISFLVTLISPLKNITPEITSRTTPSLLDLFIAFGGGIIAILALSRQKISDSFAGVAVATSLVPPLAVSGIGMALGETSVLRGSFLLFLINTTAILLVAALYLILQSRLIRKPKKYARKALLTAIIGVIILAIPLGYQFKDFVYNATLSYKISSTVKEKISDDFPDARINAVTANTKIEKGQRNVEVDINITLSEADIITQDYKTQLSNTLDQVLDTKVNLSLSIQRSIGLKSEEELKDEIIRDTIEKNFSNEISFAFPKVSISSTSIKKSDDKESWTLDARLIGDPTNQPTYSEIVKIEDRVSLASSTNVRLNILFSPVISIKNSEESFVNLLQEKVLNYYANTMPYSKVGNVKINTSDKDNQKLINIYIEMSLQEEQNYNAQIISISNTLKQDIQKSEDANVSISINLNSFNKIVL